MSEEGTKSSTQIRAENLRARQSDRKTYSRFLEAVNNGRSKRKNRNRRARKTKERIVAMKLRKRAHRRLSERNPGYFQGHFDPHQWRLV